MTTNTSARDAWELVSALQNNDTAAWGRVWAEVVNDNPERLASAGSYLTKLAIGRLKTFTGGDDTELAAFIASYIAALSDDDDPLHEDPYGGMTDGR